jgi:transposase InsO family protein
MTDDFVRRYSDSAGIARSCTVFGVAERSYRHRVKVRHDKAVHDAHHQLTLPVDDTAGTEADGGTSVGEIDTPGAHGESPPQPPLASTCRWCKVAHGTKRTRTSFSHPAALTPVERQEVLDLLCSARFVDMPAEQVYWNLLDEGTYLCSARTMYRILAEYYANEDRRRRRYTPKGSYGVPSVYASGPNQAWSWDVTLLPSDTKGVWYYLYAMVDIFSRKIVGWMVADCESEDNAEKFIRETCHRQGIAKEQLTIHADRGSIMKARKVQDLFIALGVTRSHSRPHTSNDNPYSESLFKTLKYRHDYPLKFSTLRAARRWVAKFINWYNTEHHHSGIAYFHPAQVHDGSWCTAHRQRQDALDRAYEQHPERFKKRPVAATPPTQVWINQPPKEDSDDADATEDDASCAAEEVVPV